MSLDAKITAYIETIHNKTCPDSKDAMLETLMQFHDDVKTCHSDDRRVRLVEKIIATADQLLDDHAAPAAPNAHTPAADAPAADAPAGARHETCAETYAHDEGEHPTWTAEPVPKLSFADVVGADDAVEVIREAIIMPLAFPRLFERAEATPWRGALLYGPPGTGKSLLARTAASEAGVAFLNACCADLTSKFVGGSEKLVRSLFARARELAPSLVFLDEVDSIASTRESDKSVADQRLTNQLLVELDRNGRAARPVFTLAATNLPWALDSAVMRRLAKKVYVQLPNAQHRRAILEKALPASLGTSETELQLLADSSSGFSGSDLVSFCNDLKMQPLRMLLRATSFDVRRGEDGQTCTAVHARLPGEQAGAEDEHDALAGVIGRYGEELVAIPRVPFEQVMRGLQDFRRHVKVADVTRYEAFQAA